ncbi:MAG: hypothetical protein KAH99_03075 [Verrucomicrobia bacterium]|nr:hypothetical protein [Verrucomicrobiota bacterium]
MKKLMIIALGCAVASGVFAAAGFQASLTPNIAIHDRDTEIQGVSIGLWNENPGPKFNGQFGVVNGATGDSVGFQWMLFLPSIYNYAENYTGAQLGFVNYASGDFVGAQLGAVNIAGKITGLQWGVVNYAKTAHNGLQIGLVNIIADNAWFKDFPGDLAKGMVIVNWSFGGSE